MKKNMLVFRTHLNVLLGNTLLGALAVLLTAPLTGVAQDYGPALVKVADARMQSLSSVVRVPGTVVSRDDARLSAEVDGRLLEVAEVGTTIKTGEAVLRPQAATIFVVDAQKQAKQVSVSTGLGSGDWIEVSGEVSAGDQVVTRGNERLQPGQAVEIIDS